MTSSTPTRCPKCGGAAEFHTDDGITYCQESPSFCGKMTIENPKYKPPDRRGGSHPTVGCQSVDSDSK